MMKTPLIVGTLAAGATYMVAKNSSTAKTIPLVVSGGVGLLTGIMTHYITKPSTLSDSQENSMQDEFSEMTDEEMTLDDGKPPSTVDLNRAKKLNERFRKFKALLAQYKPDQKIEYKAFCGGKDGVMVKKYVDNCVTDSYQIKKPIGVGAKTLEKFKEHHGISFEQFTELNEKLVESQLQRFLEKNPKKSSYEQKKDSGKETKQTTHKQTKSAVKPEKEEKPMEKDSKPAKAPASGENVKNADNAVKKTEKTVRKKRSITPERNKDIQKNDTIDNDDEIAKQIAAIGKQVAAL